MRMSVEVSAVADLVHIHLWECLDWTGADAVTPSQHSRITELCMSKHGNDIDVWGFA